MPENHCPSQDQLSQFLLGKLDDGRLVAIADHLEHCDTCRSHVASVELQTDCLIQQLRCEVKSDPYGKEPELEKVLSGMLNGNARSPVRSSRQKFELPPQFGKYRILAEIGAGAMGTVYRADDTQLERQVALKVPHFGPTENPELITRFVREAKAAARVDNPNICHVFDAGEIDGIYFIAMRLVDGMPLTTSIESHGRFPDRDAVELVRVLALAMENAHKQGVVHRDLKPDNILINQSGTPIITDFGLASRVEELMEGARISHSGMLIGSPAYMSPEQVNGQIHLFGPACDIYSLGVILFELLTGERPFLGTVGSVLAQISRDPSPRASERRADVPAPLDDICFRAMAKSPSDRFASMAEFADRLGELLNSRSLPLQAAHPAASSAVRLGRSTAVQAADSPSRSFIEFVREYRWIILLLVLLATVGTTLSFIGEETPPRGESLPEAETVAMEEPIPSPGEKSGIAPAVELETETTIKIIVEWTDATVYVDGDEYTGQQAAGGIQLGSGKHRCIVKVGELTVAKRRFDVISGKDATIKIGRQ